MFASLRSARLRARRDARLRLHACRATSSALLFVIASAACDTRPTPVCSVRASIIDGTPEDGASQHATGAVVNVRSDGAPELVCTGTLIAWRAVLTAAHCLALLGSGRASFTFALRATEPGSLSSIRQVHMHPQFELNTPEGLAHDLAILELDQPAAPTPVALADAASAADYLRVGAPVALVGYGETKTDGTNDGVENESDAVIADVAPDSFVVGGPGLPQNCVGDSGGPSFAPRADEPDSLLLGVVSRARVEDDDCTQGAVHTRVDANRPWIDEVVRGISARDGACVDR